MASKSLILSLVVGLLCLATVYIPSNISSKLYMAFSYYSTTLLTQEIAELKCPIATKISPKDFDGVSNEILDKILHDPLFRNQSAMKLSKAVQIVTEVTDNTKFITNMDDPSFAPFTEFHNYLEKTFPHIHKTLTKELVNTHGLVFTWQGTDPSLKPVVLTAHQDVVPVEEHTVKDWKYPPYSGHFDGEKIWGRGASDCKDLLIGQMESVELLIETGFVPSRTIILAFGFDEEVEGTHGAAHIGKFLTERYGDNSIYAIFDEGSRGILEQDGTYLIPICTAEKGYLDSKITLQTPGGHASNPPGKHTAIGIMSQFVGLVDETPFEPSLTSINPLMELLQCYAEYSTSISPMRKFAIGKAAEDATFNKAIVDSLMGDVFMKYTISTSQAATIFNGGIKANALPESVAININSRIAVDSSVAETRAKFVDNLITSADLFDLGLIVDEEIIRPFTPNGYFNYSVPLRSLEPAPITSTKGSVWEVYTGSLRFLYEDLAYPEVVAEHQPQGFIPVPAVMTANTDSKHYWNLTDNIIRYFPEVIMKNGMSLNGIHGANEFAWIEGHLNLVAFYYLYMKNLDDYTN
ncbi:hypothetical protein DASC09_006780 [Saccharomycopsis crataegensis]|uniref:Peptidase M20 dimerisation domain-containing protein n=1 Tax=Saccharomycopsis crataegensis TaxID=43959 RepID=A0AAV5QF28_9ASCO|nr:hypothetical protein DASC09_006780 [Saccharomycopsis crataegensis]